MEALDVLGAVTAYLLIGAVFARGQSRRCFGAACARWGGSDQQARRSRVTQRSYQERLALCVLGWPVVAPARLVYRFASAPVGDLETAAMFYEISKRMERDALHQRLQILKEIS